MNGRYVCYLQSKGRAAAEQVATDNAAFALQGASIGGTLVALIERGMVEIRMNALAHLLTSRCSEPRCARHR